MYFMWSVMKVAIDLEIGISACQTAVYDAALASPTKVYSCAKEFTYMHDVFEWSLMETEQSILIDTCNEDEDMMVKEMMQDPVVEEVVDPEFV